MFLPLLQIIIQIIIIIVTIKLSFAWNTPLTLLASPEVPRHSHYWVSLKFQGAVEIFYASGSNSFVFGCPGLCFEL